MTDFFDIGKLALNPCLTVVLACLLEGVLICGSDVCCIELSLILVAVNHEPQILIINNRGQAFVVTRTNDGVCHPVRLQRRLFICESHPRDVGSHTKFIQLNILLLCIVKVLSEHG